MLTMWWQQQDNINISGNQKKNKANKAVKDDADKAERSNVALSMKIILSQIDRIYAVLQQLITNLIKLMSLVRHELKYFHINRQVFCNWPASLMFSHEPGRFLFTNE